MILSISAKIGCAPQTLNEWLKQAEMAKQIQAQEPEARELKHANAIFRKASAYFAQAELDRLFKR